MLTAKMKRMSKRRQKIAVVRRVKKIIASHVGMPYNTDTLKSMNKQIFQFLDGLAYQPDPMQGVVSTVTENGMLVLKGVKI